MYFHKNKFEFLFRQGTKKQIKKNYEFINYKNVMKHGKKQFMTYLCS